MNCRKCQTEISPGETFCSECGETTRPLTQEPKADVQSVCKQCSSPIPTGNKFCGACGVPIAVTSPATPVERETSSRLCRSCKAPLSELSEEFNSCEECGTYQAEPRVFLTILPIQPSSVPSSAAPVSSINPQTTATLLCIKCSKPLVPGNAFCEECGVRQPSETTAPTAHPTAPKVLPPPTPSSSYHAPRCAKCNALVNTGVVLCPQCSFQASMEQAADRLQQQETNRNSSKLDTPRNQHPINSSPRPIVNSGSSPTAASDYAANAQKAAVPMPDCIVCGNALTSDGACRHCDEALQARETFLVRMRNGEKPEAIMKDATTFNSLALRPYALCMIGLGWCLPLILSTLDLRIRAHTWEILAAIAVPALVLNLLSVFNFIRPSSKGVLDQFFIAAIFTGVVGISLLLQFEPWAIYVYRLSGASTVHNQFQFLHGIVRVIGWSYLNLQNPHANLLDKFLANIMAPGFCEEFTKLIPIFFYAVGSSAGSDWKSRYKGLLVTGFGSGLGFGIVEALWIYSPWNGTGQLGMQMLRWYSCVPLHALWGMCDAAILCIFLKSLDSAKPKSFSVILVYGGALTVLIAGLLHGLYDFIGNINYVLMPLVVLLSVGVTTWIINRGSLTVLRVSYRESREEVSPVFEWIEQAIDSGAVSFARVSTFCLLVSFILKFVVHAQNGQ